LASLNDVTSGFSTLHKTLIMKFRKLWAHRNANMSAPTSVSVPHWRLSH
jgi:hypothetical protein